MISALGLKKAYGEPSGVKTPVLDGVDLTVAAGEFVAIVGASGSGKSTLLHVLGGLDTEYEGQVQVDHRLLSSMTDEALSAFRNQALGIVFQSFHLLPKVSALENVLLPAFFSPQGKRPSTVAKGKEALARVGLGSKMEATPAQLSGGERQRVAIARALLMSPRVLLCDEPTGNLDGRTGAGIIELFEGLNREGHTIVVVTHEEEMRKAAGRVLELRAGKIYEPVRSVA